MMTTLNPETQGHTLWNEHQTFITSTARRTARSFFKVEEEDVAQEIWVFLWEKENDFLTQGRSPEYVRTCIKNVAYNFAQRNRDTTLLETDTFYYTSDEVKVLLPVFFGLYENWTTPQPVDSTTSYDSTDVMAMFCDFSLVWDGLSETYRDVLQRKYGQGEEFSEQKDRQQASRALKRFLTTLNTETDKKAKAHTGPGSRTVITNAAGIYAAKGTYDD